MSIIRFNRIHSSSYLFSSCRSFTHSVEQHLRDAGGGNFYNLIGPNTLIGFNNVLLRLSHIEMDPFIQV